MKIKTAEGFVQIGTPETLKKESRMSSAFISEPDQTRGEKIVMYGVAGWGKSTWAANAESPIFIDCENRLKNIEPKPKCFPLINEWEEIIEAVEILKNEDLPFKTLVFDTVDKMEMLLLTKICKDKNKTSVTEFGWDNASKLAIEYWKKLIFLVDYLNIEKKMNIIFLGHSQIKTFNNPEGENYDKHELVLDKKIASLLKNWCDYLLFAKFAVSADKKQGEIKAKATGGGARFIFWSNTATYEAKNSFGLEEPLYVPKENPAQSFWESIKK